MARNQISSVAFGQVNSAVRTLPGASVRVTKASGGDATLYAAEDGATTVSNPASADKRGQYTFFVDSSEQSYTITVTLGPVSYSWTFYPPDNVASAGLIYEETWTDLLGRTSNVDGAAAEVTNDAGTHDDGTATGYDGSAVNNLGRYRWNEAWGRWVRLADQNAAVRGQPFQDVSELQAASIPGSIYAVYVLASDGILETYIRSDTAADVQSADGAWWALAFLPDVSKGEFATREDAVAAIAAGYLRADGYVFQAGGIPYKFQAGASDITGMPGVAPVDAPFLSQMGDNADPGATDFTSSAQSAIDFLPEEGGEIICTEAYNVTPGSLTIADRKMVRWVLKPGASLPGSMPGMVVSQGNRLQPYAGGEGSSSRPGAAHINYVVRHEVQEDQPNQQDSVMYIEVEAVPPSAGPGLTTELAAHRVVASITDGTEEGAGVRCYHGTAVGDGGNGKLRASRLITIGLNGHDGLVTGQLVSATRTGVIPISAGGNGVDEYSDGDAGPYPNEDFVQGLSVGRGVRRVLQLFSLNGTPARPQHGIIQMGGNAALLPEVTFMQTHGGGNGVHWRHYDDENLGAVVAQVDGDARASYPEYRSNVSGLVISDNNVAVIALPTGFGRAHIGARGSTTLWAKFNYRAVTSNEGTFDRTNGTLGVGSIAYTTGVLTGTTGTDGNFTISVSGQNLYFENRTGSTVTIDYVNLAA